MNIRYASLIIAASFAINSAGAQEDWEVIRSTALPWGSPVQNIFVDADNTKWVANTEEVKKVLGARTSTPVELKPGVMGLFQYPGGNADIRWMESDLTAALGDILDEDNYITSAFYDELEGDIWLGTSLTGAYRLKQTDGGLEFQQQLSMSNTRLRSNFIHDIKRGPRGRIWLATNDGALVGKKGDWELIEKGLIIEAVAIGGADIWMMGDGLIGKVDKRDRWELIDIPPRYTDGPVVDIAVDGKGQLWLASAVITCYNPETDTYTVFGGAEEYTSEFANRLVTDLDGAVWIGTEDKGVYVIQEGSSLVAALEVQQPVSCGGNGQDGALQVEVSGGTPPYQYEWPGFESEASATGLVAGEYQVTITDARGKSRVVSATIPDKRVGVEVRQIEKVSAEGLSDGQAEAMASGGRPPYNYKWDDGTTGPLASQLSEGMHLVTVVDAEGCEQVGQVGIGRTLQPLSLSVELVEPIQCNSGNGAALRAEPSGGQKPYRFQWGEAETSQAQIDGLAAGTYTVTVSDAQGNTAEAAYNMLEPEALQVSVREVQPASLGQSDGAAQASVTGGTPPYTYEWANGSSSAEATGLPAGEQQVIVRDANGCQASASVAIGEDLLPLQARIEESSSISCVKERDGALVAQVEGGKPPYRYDWEHDSINSSRATEIGKGEYAVTVTDAAGNEAMASYTLEEPEKLTVTAKVLSPASTGQENGVAEASASNGTPPYTYEWTNGETGSRAEKLAPQMHTLVVTDQNGCTAAVSIGVSEDIQPLQLALEVASPIDCAGNSTGALAAELSGGKGPFAYAWSAEGQSGDSADGLAAGAYQLTVTDAAGNSAQAEASLSAPPALQARAEVASPASTNASDGAAEGSAEGGTPPYTYAWPGGGTGARADGLAPGSYELTVTDQNGCTSVASVEVSEDIQPLQLALEVASPIDCAGNSTGALAAELSGGKGPFAYAWSAEGQSGDSADGLAAGAYQLTVTDAAGNSAQAEASLSAPPALQARAEVASPASTNASDGAAEGSAEGGTPPYTYAWPGGGTGARADGLAPGSYELTVTDQNGCTSVASVEVKENILPLELSLEVVQPLACAGDENGILKAEAAGGKPPYRYQWSQSELNGAELTSLAPGNYSLTLTDVQGTEQQAEVELQAPDSLQVSFKRIEPAFSEDSEDGRAVAAVTGGTPPYSYAWDNGAEGKSTDKLDLGQHSLTVTDANGCRQTADFEVKERVIKALTRSVESGQTIQMQKVQFEADSSNIQPEVMPILDEIYLFLADNPNIVVEIGGHTNNLPPAAYCDSLSTARARAVAEYLVRKGIPADQVFYKGYGKRKPLFTNRTEFGRRRNQRVEIKIIRL